MIPRTTPTASHGLVGRESANASFGVLTSKTLGEIELASGVRLVGRAPSELDARDERVVVDEVLGGQPLEPGEGVELAVANHRSLAQDIVTRARHWATGEMRMAVQEIASGE